MNTPSTLGQLAVACNIRSDTVKLQTALYYMEMYGRLWVDEDADRKEQ